MTTANLKGGFVKSLDISRDGSSASITILKSAFLKKTENYVCQMTKFITNITPPLNQLSEIMFSIRPKGIEGEDRDGLNFPADWSVESWTNFRPTPHYSLVGLAQQLQQFFHKFGFILRRIGSARLGNVPGKLIFIKHNPVRKTFEEGDPIDEFGNAIPLYDDHGWGGMHDEGKTIQFRLLPDGRFAMEFTAEFSSNFYIVVGEKTQKITGFPETMFVTQFGVHTFTADDGLDHLYDDLDLFENPPDVDVNITFESLYSFNSFDHRLTLDCVATFPLSNTISVVNGKEEHEFLLSRFPLVDFKRFETDLKMSDSGISNEVLIFEDVNVGLEDLSRGNPNIATVFLLPGNIQQVNLQLWTRYYNEGKIDRVKTDMSRGFWSTKLLFSKKQT